MLIMNQSSVRKENIKGKLLSLPMDQKFETILDAFAEMAIGTKRANFYITKNVRSKKWRVQLAGIKKAFIGDDLQKLVIEASEYIHTNTVRREGEKVLNAIKKVKNTNN